MTDALQIAFVLVWFWTCVGAFAFAVVWGQVSRGLKNVATEIDAMHRDLKEGTAQLKADVLALVDEWEASDAD